ncbi:DeoR/GlpR family DNA-binding transcription regulator [Phyllobacterium lublinensis]|uniref:DeoR/GlpR family DNA-binding transcription regulator n=1 Tax=Phyllobacterium lublinensis TaxID=2875708 RepID=UPI001CCA29FE|nr:DeoR/GlpR family DNA-binding transcription regulator [Phyllobacterium sp. 2063]
MLKDLSPDERKGLLLKRINEAGRVLANVVASEFGVSEDSIRRDLRELAEQGLVQRFHGGAARSRSGPRSFQQRARDDTAGKRAIASAAAARIPANATMLLDSSTTVLEFVRALPAGLQTCIITGSPDIATAALDHPYCEVILLGGSLNRMTRSTIGQSTLAEVQSMRIDYCVLGACAVDETLMLRAENYDDARMKLAFIQASNQVMLLATSDKLVKQGPFAIAPISIIATLVTNRIANQAILERISEVGVEVIVADD